MCLSHDLVRGWAEAILAQLGPPAGHSLAVSGPGFRSGTHTEAHQAPDSGEFASSLHIRLDDEPSSGDDGNPPDEDPPDSEADGLLVTLTFADGSTASVCFGVCFEAPLSEAEAVTLLAGQLQDAVLEETGGAPHPPCPGHSHPAVARTVDGIACWACPNGGAVRPVLPAA
ncbi:hypothetical protein AB0J21_19400 [Streptomyces sp. NPDC049954]|uniref:hypothetical protein n=1 Tax=Streptomyces sp. NPDC049954 TaxID=3155779 RepID=UPI00342B94F2